MSFLASEGFLSLVFEFLFLLSLQVLMCFVCTYIFFDWMDVPGFAGEIEIKRVSDNQRTKLAGNWNKNVMKDCTHSIALGSSARQYLWPRK